MSRIVDMQMDYHHQICRQLDFEMGYSEAECAARDNQRRIEWKTSKSKDYSIMDKMNQINHQPFPSQGGVAIEGLGALRAQMAKQAGIVYQSGHQFEQDKTELSNDTVATLTNKSLAGLHQLNKILQSILDGVIGSTPQAAGNCVDTSKPFTDHVQPNLLDQSRQILDQIRWANEQAGRIAGNLL